MTPLRLGILALLLPGLALAADSPLDDAVDLGDVDPGVSLSRGDRLYVPGAVEGAPAGTTDAALLRVQISNGHEDWRATVGDDARSERFSRVGLFRGFVCATGEVDDDDGDGGANAIVACFRARTGELLWIREFEGPGADTEAAATGDFQFGRDRVLVDLFGFGSGSGTSHVIVSLALADGS